MAKNFKLLQEKMSPGAHARAEAKADKMIREMALDELRAARDLTQELLAKRLHDNQLRRSLSVAQICTSAHCTI